MSVLLKSPKSIAILYTHTLLGINMINPVKKNKNEKSAVYVTLDLIRALPARLPGEHIEQGSLI